MASMNDVGGCLLRIRETLHTLGPKEQVLAQYILNNPAHAANLPIEDIALAGGVSVSTVVRLCKSLNYSGYKELCRNLYGDLPTVQEESDFEDIHPGDDPMTVMRNICLSSIQAIKNTQAITDQSELEAAVIALCKTRRIDFYGMGTSGLVALDASNKFNRINKVAIGNMDPHSCLLSALTLRKEDLAMLISYSGETTDMLTIARQIKQLGTPIISLTRYGKNALSEIADIHLYSSSTETLLRSGPMTSRIAQMCVVDTLYASVCSRIFAQVKPHLEKTRAATLLLHTPGIAKQGN